MKVNSIVKPRMDRGWRVELELDSLEDVIELIRGSDPQKTRSYQESTHRAILE